MEPKIIRELEDRRATNTKEFLKEDMTIEAVTHELKHATVKVAAVYIAVSAAGIGAATLITAGVGALGLTGIAAT